MAARFYSDAREDQEKPRVRRACRSHSSSSRFDPQGTVGASQGSTQPGHALGPPILQCLIFGYAATYDLNEVPYAVFDRDRSAASHELLARLDGSGVFRRVAILHRVAEMEA